MFHLTERSGWQILPWKLYLFINLLIHSFIDAFTYTVIYSTMCSSAGGTMVNKAKPLLKGKRQKRNKWTREYVTLRVLDAMQKINPGRGLRLFEVSRSEEPPLSRRPWSWDLKAGATVEWSQAGSSRRKNSSSKGLCRTSIWLRLRGRQEASGVTCTWSSANENQWMRNANLSSEARVLFHSRPKDSSCFLNQVPLAHEKSQIW